MAKLRFLILLSTVLFSSCGFVLSRSPGIYVYDSGLGAFENPPTWFWEVYGPDLVQGFRYSLDNETDWVEVNSDIRLFRPVSALPTGEYTLYIQSRSPSGIWSRSVSATAKVNITSPFVPNDPEFLITDGQWGLKQMNLPLAWGYLNGLESLGVERNTIRVAVIDTGYTEHPDLLPNILVPEGYDFITDTFSASDGDSAIDNDATDEGDGNLSALPTPIPNSWHGTTVASTIASVTNDGAFVAGVGLGNVKVLPVRTMGKTGGTTADIRQGVLYAAGLPNDSGTVPSAPAKIINMSIGAYGVDDPLLDDALRLASEAGIVIVASAGNERQSPYNKTEVSYPASSPYVIAVGATTYEGEVAPYSNPGDLLDIAAPGGSGNSSLVDTDWVITASPDPEVDQPLQPGDYGIEGNAGTSLAAPHVAGVLALLCTINDSMDLNVAKQVLERAAVDIGEPGWDRDTGHGLLDAVAAIGEYNLILGDSAVTINHQKKPKAITVDEPSGELADDPLIIRYTSESTAKSVTTALLLSNLGVEMTGAKIGRDRTARVPPGSDIADIRRQLLADDSVEEVFYNYRYRLM